MCSHGWIVAPKPKKNNPRVVNSDLKLDVKA